MMLVQVPYWGFINMLAKQENQRRPVILLDLPHVSMRVYPKGLDIDDVADALAAILASHNWAKACVVAHSYGTFVASRLCQLHPSCVHATVRPLQHPLNHLVSSYTPRHGTSSAHILPTCLSRVCHAFPYLLAASAYIKYELTFHLTTGTPATFWHFPNPSQLYIAAWQVNALGEWICNLKQHPDCSTNFPSLW